MVMPNVLRFFDDYYLAVSRRDCSMIRQLFNFFMYLFRLTQSVKSAQIQKYLIENEESLNVI